MKRIVREVKAYPEVCASRRVVPPELEVGNWGGPTPYRPSEASNSMGTMEIGVSALHSTVSRYVARHKKRLWSSSNVAESQAVVVILHWESHREPRFHEVWHPC